MTVGPPPIVDWLTVGGHVLHSCFGPTEVDTAARRQRPVLRRHVPPYVTHWRVNDGEWKPLEELPQAWGLREPVIPGRTPEEEEKDE